MNGQKRYVWMSKRIIIILVLMLFIVHVGYADQGIDTKDEEENVRFNDDDYEEIDDDYEEIVLERGPSCSAVSFCDDANLLVCSRVPDGICPQDYGDWSDCRANIYDGIKCFPCDPDCGTCGSLDVQLIPELATPGSQVTVRTKVYNDENVIYYLLFSDEGGPFAWRLCRQDLCEYD